MQKAWELSGQSTRSETRERCLGALHVGREGFRAQDSKKFSDRKPKHTVPFAEMNMCYFPLLVLKGICRCWKYFLIFSRGLNQMEVSCFAPGLSFQQNSGHDRGAWLGGIKIRESLRTYGPLKFQAPKRTPVSLVEGLIY